MKRNLNNPDADHRFNAEQSESHKIEDLHESVKFYH